MIVRILLIFALAAQCFAAPRPVALRTGSAKPKITQGLVGWWKFDEGTGLVAADLSGNNNNGTLSGTVKPAWVQGKMGSALQFSNGDNRVNCGNKTQYNMSGLSHSFSLWIKVYTLPANDYARMISRFTGGATPAGFHLSMRNSTGRLVFTEMTTGADSISMTSSAGYADSTWHHVTVIVNASNRFATMYVDGVIVSSDGFTEITSDYNALLTLGGDGASLVFNGLIDDVRIYNRALSTNEVIAIYNGQ